MIFDIGSFVWLAVFVGAMLVGLLAVYGQKYTFPGYAGRGDWWLVIAGASAGLVAVWMIGLFTGFNGFAITTTDLEFSVRYDDGVMNSGAWLQITTIVALIGVSTWNLMKYGRTNM